MGRAAREAGEPKPRVALWVEADSEVRELDAGDAARVLQRYPALEHQHRKLAAMSGRPGGRLVVIDQRLVDEIVAWLDRPRRS